MGSLARPHLAACSVVTANNPQVPTNLVVFNFTDREYKGVPGTADEHVATHFALAGSIMHADTEDAAEQKAWEKAYRAMIDERRRDKVRAAQEEGKEVADTDLDDELQRNQFNFSERAAQMYSAGHKSRVVSTVPPETADAGGSMTQWQLYDAYVAEYDRLLLQAAADKAASGAGRTAGGPTTGVSAAAAAVSAPGATVSAHIAEVGAAAGERGRRMSSCRTVPHCVASRCAACAYTRCCRAGAGRRRQRGCDGHGRPRRSQGRRPDALARDVVGAEDAGAAGEPERGGRDLQRLPVLGGCVGRLPRQPGYVPAAVEV